MRLQVELIGIDGSGGVSNSAAISFESHARNFKAFIQCIESGAPFEINGIDARKAVEIVWQYIIPLKKGNVNYF